MYDEDDETLVRYFFQVTIGMHVDSYIGVEDAVDQIKEEIWETNPGDWAIELVGTSDTAG